MKPPFFLNNNYQAGFSGFKDLVNFRRIVREYEPLVVEPERVEKVVRLA